MAKRTRFSVSRKYEVWVETEILANSFDDAAAQMREMNLSDFMKTERGVSLNDVTLMRGDMVMEL